VRIFSISICYTVCFSGGYWNFIVFFMFGLRRVEKNLYRNISTFFSGVLASLFCQFNFNNYDKFTGNIFLIRAYLAIFQIALRLFVSSFIFSLKKSLFVLRIILPLRFTVCKYSLYFLSHVFCQLLRRSFRVFNINFLYF